MESEIGKFNDGRIFYSTFKIPRDISSHRIIPVRLQPEFRTILRVCGTEQAMDITY